MVNQGANNIRLGAFVIAGLFLIILSFYMIGKNQNIFGDDFKLKVRFSNLNGLAEGNNVLFSGIQAGTVKSIEMINDTTIEVTLMINNRIRSFIHKNALAAIGTEGLMGNKVVNIVPVKSTSPPVNEGDLLTAQKMVNTDEMLQTLSKTNNNIALISESIKRTVSKIDSSAILNLLDDKSLENSLKTALKNTETVTSNANELTLGLNDLVGQIKHGKGALGVLITDTAFAGNLQIAIMSITSAGKNANNLIEELNKLATRIESDLNTQKGSAHVLLRDSVFANDLKTTMENIQKGTAGFNQNMEALKHNFLFRRYYKNLDKAQKKANPAQGK
jgi:phospholipid/cholesterol/gamma-HCH transport system substrate-binding protein